MVGGTVVISKLLWTGEPHRLLFDFIPYFPLSKIEAVWYIETSVNMRQTTRYYTLEHNLRQYAILFSYQPPCAMLQLCALQAPGNWTNTLQLSTAFTCGKPILHAVNDWIFKGKRSGYKNSSL